MPTNTIYWKSETTGGAGNALDGVNGNGLFSTDKCFVFSSELGGMIPYELTSDGTTEKPPWRIQPDTNSSSWSWRWMPPMSMIPQRIVTTGGTINPFGKILLDFSSSQGSNFTLTIGTPSSGAEVDIEFVAATSHVIRIITEATGTLWGHGDNKPMMTHDSDINMTKGRFNPTISLIAFGSSEWSILSYNKTTASVTFTTGRST